MGLRMLFQTDSRFNNIVTKVTLDQIQIRVLFSQVIFKLQLFCKRCEANAAFNAIWMNFSQVVSQARSVIAQLVTQLTFVSLLFMDSTDVTSQSPSRMKSSVTLGTFLSPDPAMFAIEMVFQSGFIRVAFVTLLAFETLSRLRKQGCLVMLRKMTIKTFLVTVGIVTFVALEWSRQDFYHFDRFNLGLLFDRKRVFAWPFCFSWCPGMTSGRCSRCARD